MAQKSFEEEFALSSRDTIDVPFWARFVRGIGLRLRALESIVIDWEEVQKQGLAVLLQRLNEVLVPAAQRIQDLTELGWLVAPSSTSVRLEAGQVSTFEIPPGVRRDLFVPSPFVAVTREANSDDFGTGRVVRYTRATGVLEVEIDDVHGSPGPHSDWQIAAVAASVQSQLASLGEVRASRGAAKASADDARADRALTAEDARNTLLDRVATGQDRIATATHVTEARAARDAARTFDPASYYLRTDADTLLAAKLDKTAKATGALLRALANDASYVTPKAMADAAAFVTAAATATVAPDFAAGFNRIYTMGLNATLGQPANMKDGLPVALVFVQDGTGGRTLAFSATYHKFPGGNVPTLSTTAGAVDRLVGMCRSRGGTLVVEWSGIERDIR